LPQFSDDQGFVKVDAPNQDVTFDSLVFDGRRTIGRTQTAINNCSRGLGSYGTNVVINRVGTLTMRYSASVYALCGSAFAISTVNNNLNIQGNRFAYNGVKNQQNMWADGLTIGQAGPNSTVSGNAFVNNTDVDCIVGGGQGLNLAWNSVKHDLPITGESYAAIVIYAWPVGSGYGNGTSGDFTGALIEKNSVDCGNALCGMGMLIGARPWYQTQVTGGGTGIVRYNSIGGAQWSFAVATAQGFHILGNSAWSPGGSYPTSCYVDPLHPELGKRFPSHSYVLAPGMFAVNDFTGDWPTLSGQYVMMTNWNNCVPNYDL
jgi:hypothetical protein